MDQTPLLIDQTCIGTFSSSSSSELSKRKKKKRKKRSKTCNRSIHFLSLCTSFHLHCGLSEIVNPLNSSMVTTVSIHLTPHTLKVVCSLNGELLNCPGKTIEIELPWIDYFSTLIASPQGFRISRSIFRDVQQFHLPVVYIYNINSGPAFFICLWFYSCPPC